MRAKAVSPARPGPFGLIAAILLVMLVSGCAIPSDNLFVLLEDSDGSVGSVEISNDQGTQILENPNQAAGLDAASETPVTEEITIEQWRNIFAEAIAAEPPPPLTFILYFQLGGTDLTAPSQELLEEVLLNVRLRVAPEVSVVGHTDRTGDSASNDVLALRRAESLRDILVDQGLDPDLVEIDSHGEANPLFPTEDGVSELRNRRVEVTIR